MSAIFSFISALFLTQPTNILPYFCSLKFENSLFSNKLFRCMFRSNRMVYTAENDQIKNLVQNQLVKSHFFIFKLRFHFAATASYKLRFSEFLESFKRFFSPFRELQVFDMHYTMNDHHNKLKTSSKHKKMGTM